MAADRTLDAVQALRNMIEKTPPGGGFFFPVRVMRQLLERFESLMPEPLWRDNARLRALIKQAEWDGSGERIYSCPWCDAWFKPDEDRKPHDAECPAFTPEGEVR